MTTLPKSERALIPIAKIEDYALNPDHPEGKHKARVFKSALGIERRHARTLADLIQSGLATARAEHVGDIAYGSSWTTWHEISGLNGQSAIVTVAWLFKKDAPDIPSLVSCYIETSKQQELGKLTNGSQT